MAEKLNDTQVAVEKFNKQFPVISTKYNEFTNAIDWAKKWFFKNDLKNDQSTKTKIYNLWNDLIKLFWDIKQIPNTDEWKRYKDMQKYVLECISWIWDDKEWLAKIFELKWEQAKIIEQTRQRLAFDTIKNLSPIQALEYLAKIHNEIDKNNFQSDSVQASYRIFTKQLHNIIFAKLQTYKSKSNKEWFDLMLEFSRIITWRNSTYNKKYFWKIDDRYKDPDTAEKIVLSLMYDKGWVIDNAWDKIKPIDEKVNKDKSFWSYCTELDAFETNRDKNTTPLSTRVLKAMFWYDEATINSLKNKNYSQLSNSQKVILWVIARIIENKDVLFEDQSLTSQEVTAIQNNTLTENQKQLNNYFSSWGNSKRAEDLWFNRNSSEWQAYELYRDINWFWFLNVSDKTKATQKNALKTVWIIAWSVVIMWVCAPAWIVAAWAIAWWVSAVWANALYWKWYDSWKDALIDWWSDIILSAALWAVSAWVWTKLLAWKSIAVWSRNINLWSTWVKVLVNTLDWIASWFAEWWRQKFIVWKDVNWTEVAVSSLIMWAIWWAASSVKIDKRYFSTILKNLDDSNVPLDKVLKKLSERWITEIELDWWVKLHIDSKWNVFKWTKRWAKLTQKDINDILANEQSVKKSIKKSYEKEFNTTLNDAKKAKNKNIPPELKDITLNKADIDKYAKAWKELSVELEGEKYTFKYDFTDDKINIHKADWTIINDSILQNKIYDASFEINDIKKIKKTEIDIIEIDKEARNIISTKDLDKYILDKNNIEVNLGWVKYTITKNSATNKVSIFDNAWVEIVDTALISKIKTEALHDVNLLNIKKAEITKKKADIETKKAEKAAEKEAKKTEKAEKKAAEKAKKKEKTSSTTEKSDWKVKTTLSETADYLRKLWSPEYDLTNWSTESKKMWEKITSFILKPGTTAVQLMDLISLNQNLLDKAYWTNTFLKVINWSLRFVINWNYNRPLISWTTLKRLGTVYWIAQLESAVVEKDMDLIPTSELIKYQFLWILDWILLNKPIRFVEDKVDKFVKRKTWEIPELDTTSDWYDYE